MGISEYKDEDQELLREYCLDVLRDTKISIRDKNNAAKLLARMQKLLQKDTDDALSKNDDVVDDTELTEEELDTIKKAVAGGELQ